jgi:hypothetical protein
MSFRRQNVFQPTHFRPEMRRLTGVESRAKIRSEEPLDPRERRQLDEFLARHRDAGGMDPSAFDGLLCAVAIGPAR